MVTKFPFTYAPIQNRKADLTLHVIFVARSIRSLRMRAMIVSPNGLVNSQGEVKQISFIIDKSR